MTAPVLGIDGWRGAWVAARLTADGQVTWRVGRFADVLDDDVAVIGVDIPVGLLARGRRDCDLAGRLALGGRAAARLFLTPPRYAFEAPDHATANDLLRSNGEPGISVQAFGLRHAVLEVDAVARRDDRVVEVHPDLSFVAMSGRPLASKHGAEGLEERVAALRPRLPVDDAVRDRPPRVPLADALDALAAAWSAARVRDKVAVAYPADGVQRDPDGRLLAIRS